VILAVYFQIGLDVSQELAAMEGSLLETAPLAAPLQRRTDTSGADEKRTNKTQSV
jgi:hypothetical protein